jgi:hypothetical protein
MSLEAFHLQTAVQMYSVRPQNSVSVKNTKKKLLKVRGCDALLFLCLLQWLRVVICVCIKRLPAN